MATAEEHYDRHLAEVYSWVFGGIENKTRENMEFFEKEKLFPRGSRLALDLGAGSGFQAIPLARLGYDVKAIDLCQRLLGELEGEKGGLPIETFKEDFLQFHKRWERGVELAVCMGDTLTHLENREQVEELMKRLFSALESKGRLVLTFRDLTGQLKGVDRFIPLRSDDNTLFTCFLEYLDQKVRVHDLIYRRRAEGWQFQASFYEKQVLSLEWVKMVLEKTGFSLIKGERSQGMIIFIGMKP